MLGLRSRNDTGQRLLIAAAAVVATSSLLAGCPGGDDPNVPAETLDPEPAGAPTELAEGRLSCLGKNKKPPPDGTNLVLPGWARMLSDPTNTSGAQPEAQAEAFDADGVSLGTGFSNTGNGRTAISVPIRSAGFEGHVRVTADGYLPTALYSSHPYTSTAVAGWVWMATPDEVAMHATTAGVTVEAGKGILAGAVHDCDVFGVANAVIRHGDSTDGVIYYEGFAPGTGTFTAANGRFVIPNVDPGPVTVAAFGRVEAGGPLLLLSSADAVVTADEITMVDLQPRASVER